MLSVIIPANNEEAYLGACLDGLAAQSLDPARTGGAEIVVAANGCSDRTVAIAESYRDRFAARGWRLVVLDIPEGSKPGALNRADATAAPLGETGIRAYLDADVVLSPDVLAQIAEVLDTPLPRYASGQLRVAPASSWVTRHFARVWQALPFMTEGVPGAGLFAVNAAGRARWDLFPKIISDDTYVRLLFTPEERIGVPAAYVWPMVEGFAGLVKVRRRQDVGVAEVADLYPELMGNEGKAPMTPGRTLGLALRMPVSFAVYAAVLVRVKATRGSRGDWRRGR